MAEIEQQPHDVTEAPVEAPAPADSRDASIDELLAQYDSETKQPEPAPEPNQAESDNLASDEIDKLLAGLSTPDPKVAELEGQLGTANGELNALKAEQLWKAEREAFDGFAEKLQAELGPNVPDDYARTQLIALGAENPALEIAWRHRNITNEQIAAADREFQQLEALYHRTQQAPDDPRKAQVLAQLEARGQELGLMMNARKMLNNAWADVVKRARKVAPPIDQEMTQMRADVAAAVRGASAPMPAEAPPNLGQMDTQQYRAYLKSLGITTGF